ncbi:MAG: ATP-binding protein [Vulcanimicrobiaceae bacterium]
MLGGFLALRDDIEIRIARTPVTALLLARLVLARGRTLDRAALAETLWPDDDSAIVRANLRRHLHRLIEDLGDGEWIVAGRTTIAASEHLLAACDVAAFESACDAADDVLALQLYSGDFAPQLDDLWVIGERERLRRNAVDLCLFSMQRLEKNGEYDKAISRARRALDIDRFNETILRHLMNLLYVSGDRVAAMSCYERFSQFLTADMGIDPMPESTMAYEALRRLEPPQREARKILPALILPFTGRSESMDHLRAMTRNTPSEKVHVVWIFGEAGMGKTRLLDEFENELLASDRTILRGITSGIESTAYEPIVRVLQPKASVIREHVRPGARKALIPLVTGLTDGNSPDVVLGSDPEELFVAMANAVAAVARNDAKIIAFEDLHFASVETIAAIEGMIRNLPPVPLTIICTSREKSPHTLASARRMRVHDALRIELSPLSPSDVHAAIGDFVTPEMADGVVKLLTQRSGGNPFFLQELVRSSLHEGLIHVDQLSAMPEHAVHLILDRLALLEPSDRKLVEIACVAYATIDLDVLAAAAGTSISRTRAACDRALEVGLLHMVGTERNATYSFSHHLLQMSIYDSLSVADRTAYHRRMGRSLADLEAAPAAQIAYHLDRGDDAAAGIWFRKAAVVAMGACAYNDAWMSAQRAYSLAQSSLERGAALLCLDDIARVNHSASERKSMLIEALHGDHNDEQHRAILRRLVEVNGLLGDVDEEAGYVLQLVALSRDAESEVDVRLVQAQTALRVGNLERAWECVAGLDLDNEALQSKTRFEIALIRVEIAAARGDHPAAFSAIHRAEGLLATVDASLAERFQKVRLSSLSAAMEYAKVVEFGSHLIDIAKRDQNLEMLAFAHAAVAPAYGRLFDIEKARMHFESATIIYSEIGHKQQLAATLMNRSVLAAHVGQHDEAVRICEKAEKVFEIIGDRRGRTVAACNRVAFAIALQRFSEALTWGRRARRLARAMGSARLEAYALANLGAARARLGDYSRAIVDMKAGLDLRRSFGTSLDLVTDLSEYTMALASVGRFTEASKCADELEHILSGDCSAAKDPQKALWVVAQLRRTMGDENSAARNLAQAYDVLQSRAMGIDIESERIAYLGDGENAHILRAHDLGAWPQ